MIEIVRITVWKNEKEVYQLDNIEIPILNKKIIEDIRECFMAKYGVTKEQVFFGVKDDK